MSARITHRTIVNALQDWYDENDGRTGPHAGSMFDDVLTWNDVLAYINAHPGPSPELIDAAPDLLAALKAVMSGQIGGQPDLDAERFRAARAAIAKAEARVTP